MVKQTLRGHALAESVRNAIKRIAKEEGRNTLKKISMSKIAKIAGTSRTTLYKMVDLIDECIEDIKAERRVANGSGERARLEKKISDLQVSERNLLFQFRAMQQHHLDIFRHLYANSSDLVDLVKPIIVEESRKSGICPLCNSNVLVSDDSVANKNVVSIEKAKSLK